MATSAVKIGRNDLCPCGSGKKYKRCCLGTIEAEHDLWASVQDAHKRVTEKLMLFAVGAFREEMERAWEDFHFDEPPEPFSPRSPHNPIFVPFFWFSWTGNQKGGRPSAGIVARTFLREYVGPLSDMERRLLEISLSEPVSFYEILTCRPGEGFTVRDVMTMREMDVKEQSASQMVKPGDILYAQMSPMPDITTMAFCAMTIIPPGNKAEIVKFRAVMQRLLGKATLSPADLVVHELGLRRTYLSLSRFLTTPPKICNTDGDTFLQHTMTYEVGSAQVAFDALAPLCYTHSPEELLEEAEFGPEGALAKVEITWNKKGNRQHKTWDNTTLGTLRIKGRSLVATVNSAERAARLRKEIAVRLGPAAVHKSTVTQTQDEMMREARQGPPVSEREKTPEMEQVARDFVQKELEAWPKKKIPVLGGRTPMQAIKTPDGLEIVESLLLEMERSMERQFPGKIRPDVGAVRRMLKLPPRG
jgi:hypothetical protein